MVDIFIIIVMLLFVLMGYKKGLVSEGIALISNIVSLILAVIAYPMMNMLLKSLGVQNWLEEQINKMGLITELEPLIELIGENVALGIMSLLAVVILWIIIKIIVKTVLKLVGFVIENLPIISGLNRLAGLVFGFFKGFLVLSIVSLLIPFILVSDLEVIQQLQTYLNASQLLPIFYEYNLAIWLIQYFIKFI